MPRELSNFTGNKDNNFNLLRIIAASAVLFSHSFALSIGSSNAEPLRKSLGMTFGSIAVDVFFIISGFLVTGSLISRKNLPAFVWARALRIYPALITAAMLTVILLGLLFTTLPAQYFFASQKTYDYLLKNISLTTGGIIYLPGVFETNPFRKSINGSLWTLRYEVGMYVTLAALWWGTYVSGRRRAETFKYAIVVIAAGSIAAHVATHFLFPPTGHLLRFVSIFFTGAAFYVLKDHIVLSGRVFVLSLLVVLTSTADKNMFFISYHLLFAYIVFFLAYVPAGRIRSFNSIGDYSYGIYIYAFPIQQCVAAAIPGVSVSMMIVLSFSVTLGFSVLSWHLVENQALKLKNAFSRPPL